MNEEAFLSKKGLYEKKAYVDFTLHGGHHSNVVRFLPPLILSDELAEKGIEIFIESVRKVEAGT